ncbi:hypothetical protein AGR2A_pa40022 [Agrobacterium genomosp. 2 str. CFBP 5494]|uniref:Uncharacterized protein n=1 Tax=Agrobacterium genomosp. 2 str. CFBP 5494 TaxID=1183436 RepID=A0A9W5B6L5_9HYPH|nr:hypothetical protein AGR2A_pa40022 [Agrobacterium genomosp. 2 str. CFBP 5494]
MYQPTFPKTLYRIRQASTDDQVHEVQMGELAAKH